MIQRQMNTVKEMFAGISPSYDRLNLLLSFGLDRLWRRRVLKALPFRHGKILDACTGTGDLAILLAKKGYDVTGVDFCRPMLEKALRKTPKGIRLTFIEADVNKLPYSDRSFHAVTSAFSLRNLPNLKKTFLETYRVLMPGGIALFLDLTRPYFRLSWFHALYLRHLVPHIGKWISGDSEAYQYLSRSIFNFKTPAEIQELLESCSFGHVAAESLSGGICTLWIAPKPA